VPVLSDQEIAQLAAGAGFTGPDLHTAIAVALAESGGDTDAIGDVALQTATYGPSVGLWQIRSVNPGHGGWFDQAHRNQQANMDPATNAANAYAIQQRYGWGQWSTYTGGQYRQFLDRARNAAQPATPTPGQRSDAGNSAGQSNPGGMQANLSELLGAFSKLRNPSGQLGRTASAARQAAARSSAFGNVDSSQSVAARHQRNTSEYGDASDKAKAELDRINQRVKESEQFIRNNDATNRIEIDQTVNPIA
jgi:hypothetical protein